MTDEHDCSRYWIDCPHSPAPVDRERLREAMEWFEEYLKSGGASKVFVTWSERLWEKYK